MEQDNNVAILFDTIVKVCPICHEIMRTENGGVINGLQSDAFD